VRLGPSSPSRGQSRSVTASKTQRVARCEVDAEQAPTRMERARLARRTGTICGKCGMSLAPAAPVYLALVASGLVGACGQLAPVCQTCAPKKYEGTPWTCGSCRRQVGGRRPQGQVFCSETCSWRWYNARRKARAEPDRHKVCSGCGRSFLARRKDAKTCGTACRQRLAQRRHVTDVALTSG